MLLPLLSLSLLRGLAHGLESDHLSAIAVMNSDVNATNQVKDTPKNQDKKHQQRRIRYSMLRRTIFWGVGHGFTLLLVGFLAWQLRVSISPSWSKWLEGVVGVMMLGLAVYYFVRLRRLKIHVHRHNHGYVTHLHFHSHAQSTHHHHGHSRAAFMVGMVHGLAGSGDLVVLGLLAMAAPAEGFLNLFIFSLGVMAGMAGFIMMISQPLAWLKINFQRLHYALGYASCVAAAAVGIKLLAPFLFFIY